MPQGAGGGRKSSASLSVVPHVLERVERLKPPDVLDIEETGVWVSIVNGHPADWFDAGAVPLLTQLCRHTTMANRVSLMIGSVGNNATLLNLMTQQRSESDIIRKLSLALRLTPQSLVTHNGNKKPTPIAASPWTRVPNAG